MIDPFITLNVTILPIPVKCDFQALILLGLVIAANFIELIFWEIYNSFLDFATITVYCTTFSCYKRQNIREIQFSELRRFPLPSWQNNLIVRIFISF